MSNGFGVAVEVEDGVGFNVGVAVGGGGVGVGIGDGVAVGGGVAVDVNVSAVPGVRVKVADGAVVTVRVGGGDGESVRTGSIGVEPNGVGEASGIGVDVGNESAVGRGVGDGVAVCFAVVAVGFWWVSVAVVVLLASGFSTTGVSNVKTEVRVGVGTNGVGVTRGDVARDIGSPLPVQAATSTEVDNTHTNQMATRGALAVNPTSSRRTCNLLLRRFFAASTAI